MELGSILSYIRYLAFFLAVILPAIYLIKRYPDIAFWLLINIYFDPGGYLSYYFEGKLSVFYVADLVILPIIFCLYAINANYQVIFKDQFLTKFSKVFLIFTVYFFVFYGGIVPYLNNDLNYTLFLQKNRTFFYYIIVLFAAYVFALRGLKYYFLTTAIVGFIIMSLLLITLVTGLGIVPIVFLERYEGSGIMRIGIPSWGLLNILYPISFIIFLLPLKIKLKLKFRKIVYIAGMLMVVTMLIALSRRNFITIPATLLILVILNSFIFRKSTAFAITKILIPFAIVLMIINLALPKYIDYIFEISQDTIGLLTEGKDTRGEEDYRVSGSGDLEITKKYISDNFLLGTGYTWGHWQDNQPVTSRGSNYTAAMDAAGDVPIYYILFGYGFAGLIIIFLLYTFYLRLFLQLYPLVREKLNLLTAYPYEILFTVLTLYTIADKFTFSLYSLGTDFTSPKYAISIGIGFALLKKLKAITSDNKTQSFSEFRLQELNTIST